MSKVHIGVGDDFPVEDAGGPADDARPYPCGGRRAHWEKRRAYWAARHAARQERWNRWCAFWHGSRANSAPETAKTDASYSDVPPFKNGEG